MAYRKKYRTKSHNRILVEVQRARRASESNPVLHEAENDDIDGRCSKILMRGGNKYSLLQ